MHAKNLKDEDPLKTKRKLFHIKIQFVPRSKHFSSRFVFVTEMKGVYCAVRTGSLSKTAYTSYLKG